MTLIIGLGNPEKEYKGTRHNVGFEAINKLAYDENIEINKAKFRSHIGEGVISGKKVLLMKPQTYMNLSGEAVLDALSFYKLKPENIIVIYDDTSIPLGQIRIRKKGSSAGHNGMKNIIYLLNTDEFLRIRIGIGEKPSGFSLSNYVLSHFSKAEFETVVEGITKATDAALEIILNGTDCAMNRFNQKVN